jgi:hypothetical protein
VKSRPRLLGVCKSCPALQSVAAKKDAKIALLEKASCDSALAKSLLCLGLISEIEACHATKTRFEEENTFLQTILRWVSSREP